MTGRPPQASGDGLLFVELQLWYASVFVYMGQNVTGKLCTCYINEKLKHTSFDCNGVFSHDVTAAMLASQNKEMAAMLVSQT